MSMQSINTVPISVQPNPQSNQQKRTHLTDNFSTKIKNSADMNDCVNVPRTIFKGYLSFMVGTALMSLGALVKNPVAKKTLNISAIGLTTFGTWAFVRPYVLKGAVPTVSAAKK